MDKYICRHIFVMPYLLFGAVADGRWCWMIEEPGSTVPAIGADGGCLNIFSHLSFLFSFFLSLEIGSTKE